MILVTIRREKPGKNFNLEISFEKKLLLYHKHVFKKTKNEENEKID